MGGQRGAGRQAGAGGRSWQTSGSRDSGPGTGASSSPLVPAQILKLLPLAGHGAASCLPLLLLLRRYGDHERLRPAADFSPREYPKPDGKITFDLPTSLFRWVGGVGVGQDTFHVVQDWAGQR